jgi:transposase
MSKTASAETGVVAAPATKRRRSKLERRRIVEETLVAGVSVARVARAHGVNANQVFHWRKLYQQGLLEVETGSTTLVPVRVTDLAELRGEISTETSTPVQDHRRSSSRRVASGAIEIEMERGHLRIEGAADPSLLRVVLECLLG